MKTHKATKRKLTFCCLLERTKHFQTLGGWLLIPNRKETENQELSLTKAQYRLPTGSEPGIKDDKNINTDLVTVPRQSQ